MGITFNNIRASLERSVGHMYILYMHANVYIKAKIIGNFTVMPMDLFLTD